MRVRVQNNVFLIPVPHRFDLLVCNFIIIIIYFFYYYFFVTLFCMFK